ncbi:MAG TPA: hypothetical protein VK483_10560 [Chitinophagaceae bacterium]|nr:hypothetical protein [Chitinophagaceae bacterium]
MRKLLPLVLLCLFACKSKTRKEANDQDKSTSSYVFSMDGLDELKIGMKQDEVEKLINQKLVLPNAINLAESYVDTAQVKYKDIDLTLTFQRQYPDYSKEFYMSVTAIRSSDTRCHTSTGVHINDTKERIIDQYPDHTISMGPDYDMVNDSTWLPSKTRYMITVKDEHYQQLIFRLENKKIHSIETGIRFSDSED